MTKVHENKLQREATSYGGFFSSSKQSWGQPQKVPPSHHGVRGGVPPNWRLLHPRHLGPLEMRP